MKRLFLTISMLMLSATVASAQTPSAATQAACFIDYIKFCNGASLSNIRQCYTKNILQITNTCINSLINDGLTTREEVASLREIAMKNVGATPSQKKTFTERVRSSVQKATKAVRRLTTSKSRADKNNTSTVKRTSRRNYRRSGPQPFTDEKANNEFCGNMANYWPGCYDRF